MCLLHSAGTAQTSAFSLLYRFIACLQMQTQHKGRSNVMCPCRSRIASHARGNMAQASHQAQVCPCIAQDMDPGGLIF